VLQHHPYGQMWMRREQFYPITASEGASSKAFCPALLPWGHCHRPGDTSNTWKKNLQSHTLLAPLYLKSSYFHWYIGQKPSGIATDLFSFLCVFIVIISFLLEFSVLLATKGYSNVAIASRSEFDQITEQVREPTPSWIYLIHSHTNVLILFLNIFLLIFF